MSLTDDISDFVLRAGYDRVGFTSAEDFTLYDRVMKERGHMYDWAVEGGLQIDKSFSPKNILPTARSIVVAVYDYFKQAYPDKLLNRVGRVYQSYGSIPPLAINRARFHLVREFLEKQGCRVGRGKIEVPDRLAAARAGVASFGKNCFAFAKDIGSFMIINTFVIDKELEYSVPTVKMTCPENCTICLDACPTGALYEPLKMNPKRCIAYNTYATPNSFYGKGQEIIPLDIREKMGTWIFGCDVCQQVCPRNQPKLRMNLPPNEYLNRIADTFDLEVLLKMTDEQFNRIYSMLTYIKDRRYYRRNAAVAMGNLADERYIPALAEAMRDEFEIVRGHAAWALGKIGTVESKKILALYRKTEKAEYVTGEIARALSRCDGVY